MESNLDDVLIDNLEEKAPKKSNKRIILIIVASVVLLGVLGVSSLMLAKQEPAPKNLEFNELEAELEKLSPPIEEPKQNKQEDEFDKLIADIKNRQSQEDAKSSTTPAQEKKPLIKSEKPQIKGAESKSEPQEKKVENPEHKIDLQLEDLPASTPVKQEVKAEPKVATPKPQAPKVAPKTESKPQKAQKEKEKQAPKKSASQLFQSVEQSVPKGFYLQVGVFGGNPQASFMNKLKAFPYKSEKIQRNGKILTRYLVGPYTSREMAQSKVEQVTQSITKPVIVEIR